MSKQMLQLESQYLQSPALWPTRAPTVFLAALMVSLLALWSSKRVGVGSSVLPAP